MLVIISDLHLTDGSSGQTVQAGAFELFAERLRDAAYRASWRLGGHYRPIDSVDLVLLGDQLDLIRSSAWTRHDNVRPWEHGSPATIELLGRLTGNILAENRHALAHLRGLSEPGGVLLPPADRLGKPAFDAAPVPIPFRTWYMVGNHDWMFHLPGAAVQPLRQTLVDALGLANPADVPFPHDPVELPELLETMRRHRVFARHGDIYDPINFEGHRDTSSLGDAIVIELVNRFADTVANELGEDLPAATLLALKELDNVRPILMIPVWIEGVLERTCPLPGMRQQVKQIWNNLADRFLDLDFVRRRDTWNPNDLIDKLQETLRFTRSLSFGWAGSILRWLNELRGQEHESYFGHALTERDFRNRRAKHIVYGHTHDAESVPLDASFAEGYVLNQLYFNAGTWRRVHRATKFDPGQREFISCDVMTYLAFYRGDERSGRPFETWSGTLGASTGEGLVHRLDSGAHEHASGEPVSASAVHGRAPHFAVSPHRAGSTRQE